MPTYEYQCSDCKDVFEAVQKISEAPLSECPRCKGKDVQRLISATSFRLKGSGWYKTDYSSGAAKSKSPDTTTDSAPVSSEKKEVAPAPKVESSPTTSSETSSSDKKTT